jgi:hypothetical protein
MSAFPQVTDKLELEIEEQFNWRAVPGLWAFEAHPDGAIRHAEGWRITGALHPTEGFVVPVSFEGDSFYVPARYLVAAAYLDKPGRVLTDNRRGGLAWLFDVKRRNGSVLDDSARNLYWHELPEPLDFDWLMRQPPVRRPRKPLKWDE